MLEEPVYSLLTVHVHTHTHMLHVQYVANALPLFTRQQNIVLHMSPSASYVYVFMSLPLVFCHSLFLTLSYFVYREVTSSSSPGTSPERGPLGEESHLESK